MNRKCPRCKTATMRPAGCIRSGPRGGKRKVFMCSKCGYRSMK